VPVGQHLSDPISQHASQTQAEVQRMCSDERENVAWKVDYESTVTFDCESLITSKPGARGRSVATRVVIDHRTHRFDRGHAFQKSGLGGGDIAAHNDGGA
jgi:hypothetical protein